MCRVTLRGVRKRYGSVDVIKGVDLEVHDGEFLVFVGPSGCGKTTTLRMIAGLESITEGDLEIDGARANDVRPAERGAAMVFQSYALYPHMTVAENMGFSLKMAGIGKAIRKERVARAAEILRISHQLDFYPKQLSGGERQRVAIGRAIVRKPKVFLFDEPLSNLDAALRVNMRIELTRLHKELGTTMIYVTHDQVEAMTMGDRIAVFNKGVIEQLGEPMALFNSPANEFVATFLGTPRINLVDKPGSGASATQRKLWQALIGRRADSAQRAGVRPEHLAVVPASQGIPATVELAEHLGDSSIIYLRVEGVESVWAATIHSDCGVSCDAGQTVGLVPDPAWALAFDAAAKRIVM